MQNPHKPNDLVRTDGKVRLTTADEVLKEVVSDSSIGSDFGLDQSHPSYRDRLLNTGTDTQNETSSKSRSATQSETREKTQSGELASLEHTHDPDGTMGCNTCQQDLSEAIKDHCQIKIGDLIASRYEIRKYLGEGGMSAVYAAFDKVIKREVALKILHRDLLIKGKGSLLRFQREAQALGNLDHPNIVKIHHFDADENAQPFIVMDIVQGEPLARRIVKQLDSLKFDDIIEIFLQVCDALSHAHERGVVHRDLKPSNIMVLGNTVKVLDFGIAKLMSEDSDQELQLTRTGEVFGSPLYMSPEQCRGQKLDIRSDIYSVGCVMFEAFTGSPPFTGNSHIDTMLKHVNDLPPSVASTMSDAKHAEKVDAILLRCLAKKPADRFQSMAEIKAALLSLDQEISGGIVGRLRQRLELMRLKMGAQDKLTKKMIAAYCAAGVIFAGLGTTALVQHNDSTARNFSAAFKDANLAHWKEIDQSGQAELDAGNFEKAMDLFCLDLAMAKQLNKPELQFASLQQIVDLLVAKEFLHSDLRGNSDYQKQLKIYRGQMSEILANEKKDVRGLVGEITNADSLSPIERTEIINRGLDSAQAFYDAGKTRDCMEILDKIFLLKTLDRDLALSGRAHFIRGLCFDRQMQTLEAREHYSIALKHREKVLPAYDVEIARSLAKLAKVSEPKIAREHLQRALGIYSKMFDPNSHQVAWANMLLSAHYREVGELGAAKQRVETAIRQCRSALEKELSVEEQNRARTTLIRALLMRGQISQQGLASLNSQKKTIPGNRAITKETRNDYIEALKLAEQMNPKSTVREGDDLLVHLLAESASDLRTQWRKSRPAFEFGNFTEAPLLKRAKAQYARALAINSRYPGLDADKKSAEFYLSLGKIASETSDIPTARRLYAQAQILSDRASGVDSDNSALIRTAVATLNLKSGSSK